MSMDEQAAAAAEPVENGPAEPTSAADEPITITTPDGHTVVMSTRMSGRDVMTLMQLERFDPKRATAQDVSRLLPELLAMLERHVLEHDFADPDILAQEPLTLVRDVMRPWQEARRARAVPKASENRSQRRSPKRR